jgi:hypothetical protein
VIEKQLEDSMHAALAGEPPLGFDPDEVVDRAARRQRQRRSAFVTAGAAAAVLAIAVAAVVATSDHDRTPRIGTPPTATTPPGVCQGVPAGHLQPSGFRGSVQIVDRLERNAPGVISEHLGRSVEPADQMAAYDCPPTIGAGYSIAGHPETFGLALIHARPGLDGANDVYANAPEFTLRDERTQEDGARIRIYEAESPLKGPLIVARLGADGMITEASVSRSGVVDEQDLVELVSDPELRFPLPR